MTYKDDEIERERRKAISRIKNVDETKKRAALDMIVAARTDDPAAFEARLQSQGIDPQSERGRAAMQAYWLIRRGQPR